MSKIKAIIIGVIVLLFFSMGVTIQVLSRKYKAEKADRERLWQNNLALTAQNMQYTKLLFTKDEFIQQMSDTLKKALNDLKIKPKTITKIVERTITDRVVDTVEVEVEVNPIADLSWSIQDTAKCWTWKAELEMIDNYPEIHRTYFEYENKTTDYFYKTKVRDENRKFLFWHLKKKVIKQVTVPKCGEATEKTIEIIKE